MAMASESEQPNQEYSWSEALSDMELLLNTTVAYSKANPTIQPSDQLFQIFLQTCPEWNRFIQAANSEKNSESVSTPTSDTFRQRQMDWRFSVSNKNSPSGLTTITPCPSLLISLSELPQDLKPGITNLFGIFSIQTLSTYLHNYRCITRASNCSVILRSPSDTTKFDIVIPKKSKPIQGAVLTALPRVFPRPGFLLQWQSTSKRAKGFMLTDN